MEWSTYIRRLGQVAGDSTQAEIADRTGMGQETISRWLRGKGQPADTAVLVAVADAYRRPRVEPFVVLGLLSAVDGLGVCCAAITLSVRSFLAAQGDLIRARYGLEAQAQVSRLR